MRLPTLTGCSIGVLTESGFVFIDCLCSLRRAKAEAWDEGFDHCDNGVNPSPEDNPYRVPSTSEGERA